MWYKIGTVTVTNGASMVTGEGTRWAGQIKQGDVFTLDGDRLYEVAAVGTDTELTLASPFAGAGGAGLTYRIIRNFTSTLTAELAARVARLLQLYETATGSAVIPAGTVHSFAGSAAPPGWLECNGAEVSRADHAALFAAIGTTHGAGNGSTTFNLPSLHRSRHPVVGGSQAISVEVPAGEEGPVSDPAEVALATTIRIIKT